MESNKKIGMLSLAFTYAGCFFGAGYVSGQELWQFFGVYGDKGYIGIIISSILFFVFGVLLLRTVQISGKSTIGEVIFAGSNTVFPKIFSAIIIFFMYGIFVIMAAGAGALLNQIFELPNFIGSLLFCLLVYLFSLYGISGAVRFFTVLIPILVAVTLIICAITLKKYGISMPESYENKNILLGAYPVSALTYVSFNMIASIGTIIPLGRYINKKRTTYLGILLGCLLMFFVALGIVLTVNTMNASVLEQLPMLDVAFKLSNICGYIYSVLLLIGMLGTSLASIVAVTEYLNNNRIKHVKLKKISLPIIILSGFILSLVGFGNLVGTVYPLFGYAGFAVLILIICSFIHFKIRAK